jgi:uncharacterized protein YgiM (DUF1202 family)
MLYFVKAVTKIVVIPLLVVALVSSANSAFSANSNAVRDGYVAAYRLNVRSAPSNKSKVHFVLKEGAKIKIHGANVAVGSWILIDFEGEKGYVRNRSNYISVINDVTPKTDFVKKSDEKMKDEKSVKAPVKKSIKKLESSLEKKKTLETKIKQEQEKIISFTKEEKIIIEGLNEIDTTLNKAKVRVAHISTNLNKLDNKIKYIVEEKEKIIEEYDQKRIYAGTRLNALYRMRMLGKFEVVSEPNSLFDFIIQQKALGIIIDSDLKILNEQIAYA